MPASPLLRIETEEGVTFELRSNLWIRAKSRYTGKWRFTSISHACFPGSVVEYAGQMLTVTKATQLPYASSRRKKG